MAEPVNDEGSRIVQKAQRYVVSAMSASRFDASHDAEHLERVTRYTKHLLEAESHVNPHVHYDVLIVILATLLHEIDDKKYTAPPEDGAEHESAKRCLLSVDCPPEVADTVQRVVDAVSYSTEMKSPELIKQTLAAHPELAVVQDADRLDALGAVGIGRAFVYGAVKDKDRGMGGTLAHIDEKLLKLQDMMKTREGRRLAKIRTEKLRIFKGWWEEEMEGRPWNEET